MAFLFSYHHFSSIPVGCSAAFAIDFLKDYPKSIGSLFPGLNTFRELHNPDQFYWEFEPLTYGGKSFSIKFNTRFEEKGDSILVHPDMSFPETQLSGFFRFKRDDSRTLIELSFDLDFLVPFPSLSKAIISPLARKELDKLFFEYDQNLQKALR